MSQSVADLRPLVQSMLRLACAKFQSVDADEAHQATVFPCRSR
jgi:hypothetical protein